MYRRRVILLSFLVTLYPLVVLGFYYQPGVLPRDYQASEEVDIRVNALESRKTLLPYDYYDIPICPNAAVSRFSENLGEILSGERTESSLYRVSTLVNENCKVLCERTFTDDELALLTTKIKDEYRVNMELDNLPLVRTSADSSEDNGVAVYEKGFPIGSVGTNEGVLSYPGVVYVNNHLTLNIYYHQHESAEKGADATMRIVGFEVEASSVRLDTQTQRIKNGKMDVCTPARDNDVSTSRQAISDPNGSQIQLNPADRTIVFVYNVRWHKSDTTWVHRWDIYLKMADSNVHWFSIAIAVVIVAFLSGTIAMMLTKTVDSDIQRCAN